MSDLCMNCGAEHASCTWGARCSCDAPNVVHQVPCDGCGAVLGVIIDDDCCSPDKMYCAECMMAAMEKKSRT